MRVLPLLAALWVAYMFGRAMERARHTPPPRAHRRFRKEAT